MIHTGIDQATGEQITWDDEATLVDGHEDLSKQKKSPESGFDPQYVATRSVHHPAQKAEDWRTAGTHNKPASGYSNPVDSPEYLEKIQYRGKP